MRIAAGDATTPATAATEPPLATPRPPTAQPSNFAAVLRGLGREVEHGEATIHSAVDSIRAGTDLGPTQLIALQVGVYRYGEAIDLASRLVDRATSAVKTVLQGGGQ